MIHHSQLAKDAWNNGNLFDYHIESARFELALRHLNRQDIQAQQLMDAMDLGLC
jgi:hypothetical protein